MCSKVFHQLLTNRMALVKVLPIVFILAACNGSGSGGGSSGETSSNDSYNMALVPLVITTMDLDNKVLPYVDISKIGSHTTYKLKFTNPNGVAVTVPSVNLPDGSTYYLNSDFYDQNWLYAQQQKYGEDYLDMYNPGLGIISGYFTKNNNTDNCFNTGSITAGGSCSFYIYAFNPGGNYTNNTTFSYPLAYLIQSVDHKSSLTVQQCTYNYPTDPAEYNCSNESAPGYASQFITYKMNAANGNTNIPEDKYNAYAYAVAQNGNWIYECTAYVCNKYALNYSSSANSLMQADIATSTIGLHSLWDASARGVYPELDGSQTWVSTYSMVNGYSLINTESPDVVLTDDCHNNKPCAPNINGWAGFGIMAGTRGLDGSMWWDTNGFGSDKYIPSLHTFVTTNIPSISAVNTDGTIISGLTCYRPGLSYTSYISQPFLNYIVPSSGYDYVASNVYNYVLMEVPDLFNSDGNKAILTAYYKIHTENGLCEVEADDYVTSALANKIEYGLDWFNGSGNAKVAPIASFYLGK
ncbi:MAG: hypothetical protein KBD37_03590 [Burkholderiales bacterium]|nr:hypothetical protein [Burkholderiales bacterium]